MLKPTLEVEVARPDIVRPASVVVPKPSVDTERSDFVEEPTAKPIRSPALVFTPNLAEGEVVPIPTKPLPVTKKFVAVDEPMTNWLLACPAIGLIANCAHGVVVEIPKLPQICDVAVVLAIKLPTVSCVPVAMRAPEELVVTIELIGSDAADKTCPASVEVETVEMIPFVPMNE